MGAVTREDLNSVSCQTNYSFVSKSHRLNRSTHLTRTQFSSSQKSLPLPLISACHMEPPHDSLLKPLTPVRVCHPSTAAASLTHSQSTCAFDVTDLLQSNSPSPVKSPIHYHSSMTLLTPTLQTMFDHLQAQLHSITDRLDHLDTFCKSLDQSAHRNPDYNQSSCRSIHPSASYDTLAQQFTHARSEYNRLKRQLEARSQLNTNNLLHSDPIDSVTYGNSSTSAFHPIVKPASPTSAVPLPIPVGTQSSLTLHVLDVHRSTATAHLASSHILNPPPVAVNSLFNKAS